MHRVLVFSRLNTWVLLHSALCVVRGASGVTRLRKASAGRNGSQRSADPSPTAEALTGVGGRIAAT